MLPEHNDPAPTSQQDLAPEERRRSWRDTLQTHPACELFPPMPPDELRGLGRDIADNGLWWPIVLWTTDTRTVDAPVWLLDGRNRLDALEVALGRPVRVVGRVRRFRGESGKVWTIETDEEDGKAVPTTDLPTSVMVRGANEDIDPYSYVVSVNIRRRHLTVEQKRDLIAKLIKATPEKSDRQIAETVKASPTFVGKVRAEKEATGDVSTVDTRIDSKGRRQPAKKTKTAGKEPLRISVATQRTTKELSAPYVVGETRPLLDDKARPALNEAQLIEAIKFNVAEGDRYAAEAEEHFRAAQSAGEVHRECAPAEVTRLQARGELEEVRRRDIEMKAAAERVVEAPTLIAQIEAAPQEQRLEIEILVIKQIPVRRLMKALRGKLKDSDTNSLKAAREMERALQADGYSLVNTKQPKAAAAVRSA